MEPAVLTGVESARYLRISFQTFKRHVNAGRIPCWVDEETGRKRYPKAALDKWLEAFADKAAS